MFPISFDATKVEPIGELTDEELEWMAEFNRQNPTVEEAAAAEHAAKVAEAKKRREILEERHQYFLKAAGAKHNGMSVAEAKKYVRARAASSLRVSFEVLEQALSQAGKVAEKVDVALELVKRAVGPHAVPNSITNAEQLTELAPVDAIDVALKAYGNGECDETFVRTLLGLLGAKVNGLKVEEELAKKSTPKVQPKMQRPPSGKVV